MTQHKTGKQRKTEKPEERGSHRKAGHSPDDRQKTTDDNITTLLARSTVEGHAGLLAGARSDEQRASLVTGLQKLYGNAYVQRLLTSMSVQAKLTVNPPDDKYEREADRVANQVTQKSAVQLQRQDEEEEVQAKFSQLQRQDEEEEVQAKFSQLQRQDEEEEVQMKPDNEPASVSETLEAQIEAARGGGQSLDDSVRASLEPQFGRDFSDVRVHTDTQANKLSRQLGAEAFTTGRDIFFKESAYKPGSGSGQGLIAHELTHVVQQQAVPAIQRVVPVVPGLKPTEASTEVPDLTNRTYKRVHSEITWGSKPKAIDLILDEVQDTKMPRLSECEDPPVEYDKDLKDTGLTDGEYNAKTNKASKVKVYIGTTAFNSVSWLYSTIMHEYQHVIQLLTDPKATTERIPIAEFAAWSWEIFHAHETGVINNPAKMNELYNGLVREAWNQMTEKEKKKNRDTFIRALEIVITATGANK